MVSVPHGGMLVNRVLSAEAARAIAHLLPELPSVTIGPRDILDLNLIAVGALSPLTGYMTAADYHSVVETMHLANGLAWPIPITLAVSAEQGACLSEGTRVVLRDPQGDARAVLELQERFSVDRAREAKLVYQTEDEAHPGVRALYDQGEILLAGPVSLLTQPALGPFSVYPSSPSAARAEFAQRDWKSVVGFQTRNPVHRAHEFIQKCAMEIVDGLYLHPLVGETKDDDVPAPVRMRCYEILLEHYYPADKVVLGTFPARMRYAGPREAIFHALVRKNYGCTHFIVGRDHAGVGSYYGTYDAQMIFRNFGPDELGITPLFFENSFYCKRCAGMASTKTCPHSETDHVVLSGTRVRAMLRSGEVPPPEFSRPEVARVLMESLRSTPA